MLGVRRFKGTQIDLWQGDIKKFATDLSETSPEVSPSEPKNSDGLRHAWAKLFSRVQAKGGRHLSIAIHENVAETTLMHAIKDFLEGRDLSQTTTPIKRITLVADSMATYDKLQGALFSSFEDLDHDSP